jgi:hypothetical protein
MKLLVITALALTLTAGSAFAQDGTEGEEADEALDLTMTLMPQDAELPDVVTADIELPKDEEGLPIPSEQGVEHGGEGLETANLAREDGRAFGEAAAAAAQENREDVSRGSMPDLGELLPDNVPEIPEIPEHPTPPTP